MKKWQELSKRAKAGLVGGAAIVLIGGTAGAVKVNADNQYRDQKSEITKKLATASEKGELAQKVGQLVDKDGFLKKDLTFEEVSKLQAELSTLNDDVKQFVSIRNERINLSDINTLEKDLSVAEKKLAIEEQLKADLTSYNGWLNAKTEVKKLVLSDKASAKLLEGTKKTFSDENLAQDNWSKKIDEIFKTAESQLSDAATAEKLVDALYKDKKVIKDVKRSDYEKAVKAVKGLTRKSDKDQLNKKLDAVKKVIEEREKAEKSKKEAEAKKKAEAEAAEKAKADAAAQEKAEATKDVASTNDTETINQSASNQNSESDWSDSGSNSSGSSNAGNSNNWDYGTNSNQGNLTGGNQSSGYTIDGFSNSGGSNQSSGGYSSNGNGSSSNQGATTGGNQSSGNASNSSSNSGSSNQSSGGSSSSSNGLNGSNSGSTAGGNTVEGSTSGENNGGSTEGNSGSDGETTDADMEAAGWIKPKYPIESDDFWDWLFNNGYYGYFQSGEWIQPY